MLGEKDVRGKGYMRCVKLGRTAWEGREERGAKLGVVEKSETKTDRQTAPHVTRTPKKFGFGKSQGLVLALLVLSSSPCWLFFVVVVVVGRQSSDFFILFTTYRGTCLG